MIWVISFMTPKPIVSALAGKYKHQSEARVLVFLCNLELYFWCCIFYRLKPLKPVHVEGPSINNCRGILSGMSLFSFNRNLNSVTFYQYAFKFYSGSRTILSYFWKSFEILWIVSCCLKQCLCLDVKKTDCHILNNRNKKLHIPTKQ